MAAEIVITKSVHEYIERKMKNWQVLTVFPLMKNGAVLTAGLNGSKGAVVGSPVYNKPGWLEEQAINFFEYKGTNAGGVALAWLRDVFITSSEMQNTINSFKRDNGFGVVSGSSDVIRQGEIMGLLDQVAKSNISGFNAYKKLYFDARVESSQSDAGKLAYRKYSLRNISELDLQQTKIVEDNLVPISSNNNLISRLSNKEVFKFVGEVNVEAETAGANYTSDKYVLLKSTEGNGATKSVHCKKIKSKDENGEDSTVFVLPYLRSDAKLALEMVVEKICKTIQPDYEDEDCKFEYLHQHNIVLHNGVMINEKNWMSTGYGFILEVKSYDEFSNIIKEIDDNDKLVKENGNAKYKLLEIKQDDHLGKNTYDFWVSPIKA